MDEGPRKDIAFQTVLAHSLQRELAGFRFDLSNDRVRAVASKRAAEPRASGTTGRLMALIAEGVFAEPRTLAEVRQVLSEKGWRYSPEDLGTPLTRLVQRKLLRRTLVQQGRKRTWRYSDLLGD